MGMKKRGHSTSDLSFFVLSYLFSGGWGSWGFLGGWG